MGRTAPSVAGFRKLFDCQLAASGPVSASPSPTTAATTNQDCRMQPRTHGRARTLIRRRPESPRRIRADMAGDAVGKRELLKEIAEARFVAGEVWEVLGIGPLQINVRQNGLAAMSRTGDVDHIQVMPAD